MNPAASPTRRYHVWFSTKHRKEALQDEVETFVLMSLREIAARSQIEIVEMEAAFDHLHILLGLRGDRTLSSAMHQLKGASARATFERFPELRIDMASNSFWQKGFGYRFVPSEEVETVRRYIQTQDDRPLRHRSLRDSSRRDRLSSFYRRPS